MSVTKYLRENAYRYSDKKSLLKSCVDAGYNYKCSHSAFTDIQKSRNPISIDGVPCVEVQPLQLQKIGLTEGELRQKHDVRFIIQQAASRLERGVFVMDADFVKQCNMRTQAGYRQFTEASEFTKYKGRAGGIVYWSHPDSIQKMKNEGILT